MQNHVYFEKPVVQELKIKQRNEAFENNVYAVLYSLNPA